MTENTQWSEDERFWEAILPFIFSDQQMEMAPVQVEKILTLMKPPPGAHILDLCCGIGRHSLEFARRGYRVTGVDRTQRYLDTAITRADADKLDIEFILGDMRTYRRQEAFDGVTNLFTSFGFFDNPDDENRIIENIYHSLKPDGCLVIDLVGKEILARNFQPRDWTEAGGVLRLEEREPVENWTYMNNRWLMIRDGKIDEFTFKLRIYSGHELALLLTSAGFGEVSIYGSLDGSPYDHTAQRMVAVARKG